ncbi:MAG: hypothetical protein BIFFINMI_03636 [Phycisphaerae bacterium]|nr:hypothetical protein [Phycisphaerae bacterium]
MRMLVILLSAVLSIPSLALGRSPTTQGESADVAATQPAGADAIRPGWKLVWNDEFDAPGLPDPAKWGYEEGFIRNHESQYYTKARRENCRVEDGVLVIEARKERFGNARYTSASIHTQGKASWTGGRIEIRARLPRGAGVWPAFWTLGDNIAKVGWPSCGEIDIMEFVGKTPDQVYGTLHWNRRGHQQKGGSLKAAQPWADFHVYAAEWSVDRMDFYFDRTRYASIALSDADIRTRDGAVENAFRLPHHVKLNFALGGDWGGKVDDSALPQRFVVDYVRVYQKADAPTTQPDDYRITCRNARDRVAATTEDGCTVFTVASPGGIGQAVIQRPGNGWPKAVELRLNLKGLESLRLSNGQKRLSVSVNRDGVSLSSDGKMLTGRPDGPADPLWTNVRSPDDAGHGFRLVVPPAMLDANAASLSIEWIDFYRG